MCRTQTHPACPLWPMRATGSSDPSTKGHRLNPTEAERPGKWGRSTPCPLLERLHKSEHFYFRLGAPEGHLPDPPACTAHALQPYPRFQWHVEPIPYTRVTAKLYKRCPTASLGNKANQSYVSGNLRRYSPGIRFCKQTFQLIAFLFSVQWRPHLAGAFVYGV